VLSKLGKAARSRESAALSHGEKNTKALDAGSRFSDHARRWRGHQYDGTGRALDNPAAAEGTAGETSVAAHSRTMMHAHKTGKAAEVRAATGQLCCALQLDVTSALSRAWRDDWKCRRPDEVIHKGLHSSVG
jgi:hypothetical protein